MNRKIVVIDDEDFFREPLVTILSKKGFDIVGFPEGQAALDWWEQGNNFDLLLLDLNNPLGMDGFKFLKEIPNHGYQGEIYLISGDENPEIEELKIKYPQITKTYVKPFPVKEMIEQIEESVNPQLSVA